MYSISCLLLCICVSFQKFIVLKLWNYCTCEHHMNMNNVEQDMAKCLATSSVYEATFGGTSQGEVPELIEIKNNFTHERLDQTVEDITTQV